MYRYIAEVGYPRNLGTYVSDEAAHFVCNYLRSVPTYLPDEPNQMARYPTLGTSREAG